MTKAYLVACKLLGKDPYKCNGRCVTKKIKPVHGSYGDDAYLATKGICGHRHKDLWICTLKFRHHGQHVACDLTRHDLIIWPRVKNENKNRKVTH